MSRAEEGGILRAAVGDEEEHSMRRYETDCYGMIASFDICEALRRAEKRRLESECLEREREARKASRIGMLARVRALVVAPRRSTA